MLHPAGGLGAGFLPEAQQGWLTTGFTNDTALVGAGNAVHIKNRPDGKVEVAIHVPDVTHFVKPNSLVDREAKKRGTSVQLINRFCALLPPKLATELCQLSPDQERLTVSVVFSVNPHTGAVAEGDAWVGRSIIKSAGTVSLSDIEQALTSDSPKDVGKVPVKTLQMLNHITIKLINMMAISITL